MLIEDITAFQRVTDAASEPITLTEAKAQLRVDTSDEDTYITSLIQAAREHAEDATGLALLEQTWRATFDNGTLPDGLLVELPRPPLISVDSITYLDTDGNSQTLSTDNYTVDTDARPGRILFSDMPSIKATLAALTINYTCGFADADSVPMKIKQAMLLMITHWFEIRQPVMVGTITSKVPISAEPLLRSERIDWL